MCTQLYEKKEMSTAAYIVALIWGFSAAGLAFVH